MADTPIYDHCFLNHFCQKPADLDLQYLQNMINPGLAGQCLVFVSTSDTVAIFSSTIVQ